MIEIILDITTVVICFFVLYSVSKSDFVLLRQNISLSQIFDAAIVSGISAFLFGRVFFMVDNFKSELLSLLRFFHILKYPGLSIFGVLLGGLLCIYLIFMKKKGVGRICDIFAISFFPLVLISQLFLNFGSLFYMQMLLIGLSIIFYIFILRSHNKYVLRDGSVGLFFIAWVSLSNLASELLTNSKNAVIFPFTSLSILCLLVIPASLVSVFINQRKKNS